MESRFLQSGGCQHGLPSGWTQAYQDGLASGSTESPNEQRTDIARGAAEARWGSRSIPSVPRWVGFRIDREPQRASAAPRAMSVRCSLLSLLARALPPFIP